MKKLYIHCGFFTLLIAAGTAGVANNAYAAPSAWSQLASWFNRPIPQTYENAEKPADKSITNEETVSNAAPLITNAETSVKPISHPEPSIINADTSAKLISNPEPVIINADTSAKLISNSEPVIINAETSVKPISNPEPIITKAVSSGAEPTITLAETSKTKPSITPAVTEAVSELPTQPNSIAGSVTPVSADIGPKWGIGSFPAIAINQKNYADINLNEYLTANPSQGQIIYFLTPGKLNPSWVSVQSNGLLHIAANKISAEDVNTTQVIYLTATDQRNGQSSAAQLTIQITANDALPSPEWQTNFNLNDAIPGQAYFVNLANAINIDRLPDNDQLMFQLVNSPVAWLQIGENGFSLAAKKIPEDASAKSYKVILRVTSKMSGKSEDFTGKIYVNPMPQPLQWQTIPSARLNKNYSLDLSKYITSNIRNDQFSFHIDVATLPYWLSIQNNRVLTGVPQEAKLLDYPQKITVIAKSLISGMTAKINIFIPVSGDENLAPQWKKDFFHNFIAGETYRSDDLATVLENSYPHDELSFSYLSGPEWLNFSSLCHCLASKGEVPNDAAGKSFTIQLRVHSKASGKTTDYAQSIMVYRGIPQWLQTTLPDTKIAQGGETKIPLSKYVQDDISGDQFIYRLDQFHSPRWIGLVKEGEEVYLFMRPDEINPNEVGTTQTVRVLATSQSTHKTSVQLLSVNIKENQNLPQPVWKNAPLSIATVGFEHAMDLLQYVQGGLPNDRLTVTLGTDSPSWLTIKDNRLSGIAPRDQIGGPYPVSLIVHSQASNIDTVIHTQITVQLAVVEGDNMELHSFYENHQSIIIRGLKKNHTYRLVQAKGSNFDYGPFYSPYSIKTDEDWNNNPFYSVNSDKLVKTGDDGTVSIVYYSSPTSPPPDFQLIVLS